ncbi:unnamed protein product, partial [Discosporangium mesarthrocarpum]
WHSSESARSPCGSNETSRAVRNIRAELQGSLGQLCGSRWYSRAMSGDPGAAAAEGGVDAWQLPGAGFPSEEREDGVLFDMVMAMSPVSRKLSYMSGGTPASPTSGGGGSGGSRRLSPAGVE